MVVGKNNSQNLARAVSSPKLPPLPKLRVRRPNTTDANPCIGVMSSVLGTASLEDARGGCKIGWVYNGDWTVLAGGKTC